MSDIDIDEAKLKALFKAAIIEVIEENQEFVREVLQEAFEDLGLVRAIQEGEASPGVSRDDVLNALSGAE